MGIDPRHIVAGVLTITMFVMLANMIKRDHFDPPISHHVNRAGSTQRFDDNNDSEQSLALGNAGDGPWKEETVGLKRCWFKPVVEETEESRGFVTFSLTNGPEYHVSQIADAVVVARYLRASLVIPDIRGSQPGDRRNFGDIYDIEKFVSSLDGVVKVVKSQPLELSSKNLAVLRVPNRVTEDYIAENIEPAFRSKGNVRLATYFPSVNMKKINTEQDYKNSIGCLVMYGALELQPDVQEVVDSMVGRLKTLSRKSDGQFVAVDLRLDMLDKKGCQGNGAGSKKCYSPQEIALFLRKLGFDKDTAIYLTQSRWDSSLDALKDLFPKSYTKEGIMPMDKKSKFLESEYEKVIDFYMCSQSDVFVPAISGLFYANVAGKRIASGKTQILVPANIPPASSASVAKWILEDLQKAKQGVDCTSQCLWRSINYNKHLIFREGDWLAVKRTGLLVCCFMQMNAIWPNSRITRSNAALIWFAEDPGQGSLWNWDELSSNSKRPAENANNNRDSPESPIKSNC